MVKCLHNTKKTKMDQTVNWVKDALIDLINAVNKKLIPENENKVIDIIEKFFQFNKQLKRK